MQVSEVLQGDPATLVTELTNLAAVSEIQIIKKTKSSGKYIVIYEDAGPTGQTVEKIQGDPDALQAALDAIISGGGAINIVENTFNAAVYLVVWT